MANATRLHLVTINGSYSTTSKTDTLIDLIIAQVEEQVDRPIEVTKISIAQLAEELGRILDPDEATGAVREAMDATSHADLLIAASPVFRGSYSGLFKHFIDLLDQYSLANKPTILAATGGSDRHMLMIDQELRPLFAFLQAHAGPTGVFASAGDFAGGMVLNPQVHARAELVVKDLLPLLA